MSTLKVNDIIEATPKGATYTLARVHARASQTETALYNSHNVSSISDNGNGSTTFNFTNNFRDTSYSILSNSNYNSEDKNISTGISEIKSASTASIRISGVNYEGKAYDNTRIDMAVFGKLD